MKILSFQTRIIVFILRNTKWEILSHIIKFNGFGMSVSKRWQNLFLGKLFLWKLNVQTSIA